MKRIKNILLSACLSLSMVACNEDPFLTEVNPNAMTSANFWQNEDHVNSALTTVYGALQFRSIGGDRLNLEMAMGDLTGSNYWTFVNVWSEYKMTDNSDFVTQRWSEPYIGIFRANQIISKVPGIVDEEFTENDRNFVIAQAKFLRAFFYWRIVQTFGQAVITTKATGLDEDLHNKLSPIGEVNEKIIIPDLLEARKYLPKRNGAGYEAGRVTWGAATALLGKVHLYAENWKEAETLFDEVINDGTSAYALTGDILDNFRHDMEFNEESIFEIAFDETVNPGATGSNVDDNQWAIGAEASALARMCASWGGGGWANTLPTYYIHELLLHDTVPEGASVHSPRLNASIAPVNGQGNYYTKTFAESKIDKERNWQFGESSYIKKFTNWYWLENEDRLDRSGINFREIRLADVYLMAAEAALKSDGNTSKAINYIDVVRKRAGVVLLSDYIKKYTGKFPQFHVSKELNKDATGVFVSKEQPLADATVENLMLHLQMVERPQELCFEGHRFKDLRRWGIVEKVLTQHRADEVLRVEKYTDTGGSLSPLFINGTVRQDFVTSSSFFNAARHSYLPIPSAEVQTNESF